MTDAVLSRLEDEHVDFSIDTNGDILTADFLDTAITVSIYEEKRASPSEVVLPELRRGWIGNESTPDFERGSKIWLYSQSRLTQEIANSIVSAADESLAWLVNQGFAISVISSVELINGRVILVIELQRPSSITVKKELFLWDNSGVTRIN